MNLLPNNPLKLEQLIGATDSVDLSVFANFVAFAQVDEPTYEDRSAKRRIPDPMRAEALLRDGARCRRCRTGQSRSGPHHSGQQGRENRRVEPADPLSSLQPP